MITFGHLRMGNKMVACSNDEPPGPQGDADGREPVGLDPAGVAQPLAMSSNDASSALGAPATTELEAEFEKYSPGGTVVQVELRRPADAFSLTTLFGPWRAGKSTTLQSRRRCDAWPAWTDRNAAPSVSATKSGLTAFFCRRNVGSETRSWPRSTRRPSM